MYICPDCRAVFEVPRFHTETAWGIPFAEWSGCPKCGSEEFTEYHACVFCGEPLLEDGIRLKDGDYVCASCYEKIP